MNASTAERLGAVRSAMQGQANRRCYVFVYSHIASGQPQRCPMLAWARAFVSGQRTSIALRCDCRGFFDGFPEVALDVSRRDPGGSEIVAPLELGKRC